MFSNNKVELKLTTKLLHLGWVNILSTHMDGCVVEIKKSAVLIFYSLTICPDWEFYHPVCAWGHPTHFLCTPGLLSCQIISVCLFNIQFSLEFYLGSQNMLNMLLCNSLFVISIDQFQILLFSFSDYKHSCFSLNHHI